MKKILFLSLLFTTFLFSCKSEEKKDEQLNSSEFRGYAKEYMSGLKSVLLDNMQKGGPLQGVAVCSDTASDLTKMYSEKMGVEIKRVSFKNRNSSNFPDAFEKTALSQFEKLSSNNKLDANTEIIKKINENGIEVIRYIKPILVEAPCLNCHGDKEIMPEVSELIKKKYPEDKATGYKIGDLRGAISITKKI